MVGKTSNSRRWSNASNPRRSCIYSVLSQRNWRVETMGSEIMRLCDDDASWLLQDGGNWGCGNSGTGACWQTVEDGWWTSSTACVEICWSWVHWQRGFGCLGSEGSCMMARKPLWDEMRMGWDEGWFYQECLPSPSGGWIRLNVGAWWDRENCLGWWLERKICPSLLLGRTSTNRSIMEFGVRR